MHLDLRSEFLKLIRQCHNLNSSWLHKLACFPVHPSHRLHKTCHLPSPDIPDSAWVTPTPSLHICTPTRSMSPVLPLLKSLRTSCIESDPKIAAAHNLELKSSYTSCPLVTKCIHGVYQGHMNTFSHILKNHEHTFHIMMSDIYSQARWVHYCIRIA